MNRYVRSAQEILRLAQLFDGFVWFLGGPFWPYKDPMRPLLAPIGAYWRLLASAVALRPKPAQARPAGAEVAPAPAN